MIKKTTLRQQTAAVKDHVFCHFQIVISVLLWKYPNTWKFSVHYPPYYLQKSGKHCNFHFTGEEREVEKEDREVGRGLLASWSLPHIQWESKGRLSDLRIKKEMLRVKARCSQKVKRSKKLPLETKSEIQVSNSKMWHKTSYTSPTLETPGKQNIHLQTTKGVLECLMHWERNSEQKTTTSLYLFPVSTHRPVRRASPGKQPMCGITFHKGTKSRCPMFC